MRQNVLKKSIGMLLTLTMLSMASSRPIPTPSRAAPAEPPQPNKQVQACQAVLQKCDEVVKKKNEELKMTNLALDYSTDTNKKLAEQVKEKDEQLGSIWRSPYLFFALGVVATSVLFGVTR